MNMKMDGKPAQYHPIADYGLLSDCRSTALVSRTGSIDWCCMPRMDADSCFGRLLDAECGGYCAIAPLSPSGPLSSHDSFSSHATARHYEYGTLVLTTSFTNEEGRVDIHDFFCYREQDRERRGDIHHSELIRLIKGVSGCMKLKIEVVPRFDYGETSPQIVPRNSNCYVAFGSNKALLIRSAFSFSQPDRHELSTTITVNAGECLFLSLSSFAPQHIEDEFRTLDSHYAETAFNETVSQWHKWLQPIDNKFRDDAEILHSALILKALTYSPSGAIVGAPTTSLPETIGAQRNWDYRFCWIRDSVYAAEILFKLGLKNEANQLRAFIERSCAGSADQLQTLYAIDGGRRLTEIQLEHLSGYRNSAPVRIGNDASTQDQWDMYGELLRLASLGYEQEHEPDADYWEFLIDVLDHVCLRWHEPDRGIWEFRDRSRHLVHSKACCWSALKHGVALAQRFNHKTPYKRWLKNCDDIRDAIDEHGFDRKRGVFRQAFDADDLDASILRLPRLHFIAADDPRMLSTVDIIRNELDADGLLRRYNTDDGLDGEEGIFLPCTFWLVTCLAHQHKLTEAHRYYRNAAQCANDLGLFSEEYDKKSNLMLGNFPQALTHSSQIVACMALREAEARR